MFPKNWEQRDDVHSQHFFQNYTGALENEIKEETGIKASIEK